MLAHNPNDSPCQHPNETPFNNPDDVVNHFQHPLDS
jgi:hypothetical protein